jgi:hypothetical protein
MAETTHVRIGHCSPDAPAVDVWIDGSRTIEGVAFGDVTEYADIESGSYEIAVTPAGGDADEAVIEATLAFDDDEWYTVCAVGTLSEIEALVVADEFGTVPSGKSHLRFVHCSPDAPAVDVAVADGPILFEDVEFKQWSDYKPVDAGSYDVEVRIAGREDVALELRNVELSGGRAATVFAMGRVEDGSLKAVTTVDGEAMAPA